MNKKSILLWVRLALGGAIAGVALGNVIGVHSILTLSAEAADVLSASIGTLIAAVVVKANHIV